MITYNECSFLKRNISTDSKIDRAGAIPQPSAAQFPCDAHGGLFEYSQVLPEGTL